MENNTEKKSLAQIIAEKVAGRDVSANASVTTSDASSLKTTSKSGM